MRSAGSWAVKSKFMIAAEHPRYPAGVVAATVSRICFHRPGFFGLNASVNQRSTVASASGNGAVAVAYRSFRPILSATVNERPRTPRNGVVLVDVPRNSRATLLVRTAAGTFKRTIVTYDSLASEVNKPVPPGEG